MSIVRSGYWRDPTEPNRCDRCATRLRGIVGPGFTLIELLVVVAIIAVLIAMLLPALVSARDLARQMVCASRFHALGQAMHCYTSSFNDWLPGSPNTSGNGANPGGASRPVYGGTYHWDASNDAFPAVHIFDWASPLLQMMTPAVPEDIEERYDQSKRWVFQCPANGREAELNHASRIDIITIVSSYATCRYLTYVPLSRQNGTEPGALFWAHPFVPDDYMPKATCLNRPNVKVFLADACKIDRSNQHRLSNQDYGYSTHGPWLNENDVDTASPSLSYRFEPARSEAFRHRNGLNMLFFDGHVEHHAEGDSQADSGFGTGARQAKFWFPSGTDTRDLPSSSSFNNIDIIVP